MSLSKSKYARKTKEKPEANGWQDLTISEDNMTAAIAQFLTQMSIVAKTKDIERVIVGDLANGFYPLAVLSGGRKIG